VDLDERLIMTNRIALLVLVTASHLAMAGDQFTTAERQQIDIFMTSFEGQCQEAVRSQLSTISLRAPAMTRWLGQLALSKTYCPCTAAHLRGKMKPALMGSGSEDELGRLAKLSGTECIVPVFKSTFHGMCMDMLKELEKGATKESLPGPGMCTCVQADIDKVSVESFDDYHRRTIEDYREYQRTRVVPTTGDSLFVSMYRCGLNRVRKKPAAY